MKCKPLPTELEASRLLALSQKTSQTERNHAWFLSHFYHSKHPIIEASDKVLVLTAAAITIEGNRCCYFCCIYSRNIATCLYLYLLYPLDYPKESECICGEGVGEVAGVA